MFLILADEKGKELKKVIKEMSLEEAKDIYENDIFRVLRVEDEKFGDYSNEKAALIIAQEGLDYAVRNYCSYKEFKDPKTRKLWRKAELACEKLYNYLNVDELDY